jgi:hypothetical protein
MLGACKMNPHQGYGKAFELMKELTGILQKEFGHVVSGKTLIANKVSYPKHPRETAEIKKGVFSLLEGSLLVYLFAIWEVNVPTDVDEWLTQDERLRLDAFKHVRHSVAHKYRGGRADSPRPRQAFEAQMPFSGIIWDQTTDTIDISNSSVAIDCYHLMEQLSKQLVVRLHKNQKP